MEGQNYRHHSGRCAGGKGRGTCHNLLPELNVEFAATQICKTCDRLRGLCGCGDDARDPNASQDGKHDSNAIASAIVASYPWGIAGKPALSERVLIIRESARSSADPKIVPAAENINTDADKTDIGTSAFGKGRVAVAAADMSAGTEIIAEPAYIFVPSPSHRGRICAGLRHHSRMRSLRQTEGTSENEKTREKNQNLIFNIGDNAKK